MKALIKTAKGQGNISLENVPVPKPGKNQVLIEIQAAGVCGTDIHIYYDRFANSPPFILGHEFSGVIVETGNDVKEFKVGDRIVAANNPFACNSCRICSLGFPNLCSHKKAMGIHSNGCFAEYAVLPENLIHRIPDGVSFEEACLTEPLAVAVHSVSRCGIEIGDCVVVFGPGAIGLLASQVAKAEGAEKVILVGTSNDIAVRFKCAHALGIETLNIDEENLPERIHAVSNGYGSDVVIEASGSKKAIAQGLDLLRKNGRMAISGITGENQIAINWDKMVAKAVSLFFAYSSVNRDWEKSLNLLAQKKVRTLPLITHRFEIEQWKKAFEVLEQQAAIRPIFVLKKTV